MTTASRTARKTAKPQPAKLTPDTIEQLAEIVRPMAHAKFPDDPDRAQELLIQWWARLPREAARNPDKTPEELSRFAFAAAWRHARTAGIAIRIERTGRVRVLNRTFCNRRDRGVSTQHIEPTGAEDLARRIEHDEAHGRPSPAMFRHVQRSLAPVDEAADSPLERLSTIDLIDQRIDAAEAITEHLAALAD